MGIVLLMLALHYSMLAGLTPSVPVSRWGTRLMLLRYLLSSWGEKDEYKMQEDFPPPSDNLPLNEPG